MRVVDLDIALLDMPYPVTRRLRVPMAVKLSDLHKLLQAAMPWDNCHLHDFTLGGSLRWVKPEPGDWGDSRDPAKTTLAEVMAEFGKQRAFEYTYDMGDSWEHRITPGKPHDLAEGEPPIALLSADGACAPEDSGGAPGFDQMLEVVADPSHAGYAELVDWLGDRHPWNPVADAPVLAEGVRKVAARVLKTI